MKKGLVLALVGILLLGALTGCGKKNAAADDQLATIQKSGKFIVGIEGVYPPFNYHDDNGDLAGFDIDLGNAIAEKLGVTAEFVEAPWDSLLTGVDSKRFDTVINNVSISEERKAKYDFSDPYIYSPTWVLVRTDNDSIKSTADINGKKIAENSTSVLASFYEDLGAELVAIDTSSEAINLLLQDRVDFLSFSGITFSSYMEEHPDTDIKIAFDVAEAGEQVGIPIRKGEERLNAEINKILEELRADGTLAKLSEKHLKHDFTTESSTK